MTDEKSAESVMPLKIGDFVEGKGVYAGVLYGNNGENQKSLFVALKNADKKMDWDTAMAQDYGQYRLPDIRELTQINLYKDAINAGLKQHGGEALRNDWYWSSTEYYNFAAWNVNFNSGARLAGSKFAGLYVRPVLAF